MNRRVLITRPLAQAAAWVHDLQVRGVRAQALPLIEIQAIADVRALRQAWARLSAYRGVMFVSAPAVQHFFAHQGRGDAALPWVAFDFETPGAGAQNFPRAWATGPGTVRALLQVGVARVQIDAPLHAPFDSESLWSCVVPQMQVGDRVLIVRGGDVSAAPTQGGGRDWFAKQVTRQGAQAEFVMAYQRCAPTLSAAQLALARQAAGDGSVWLFSSSQAIAHLRLALPQQNWAHACALATHPRIAQVAQQAGFAHVGVTAPTLDAVMASIESMA